MPSNHGRTRDGSAAEIGGAAGRFFELGLVPMAIVSARGSAPIFDAVNAPFAKLLGMDEGMLEGVRVRDLLHPDDANAADLLASSTNDDAAYVPFEARFRHANGAYVPLSWSSRGVSDERRVYAVVRELARCVARSESPPERGAELDAVLRAIPDIYFRLDADGRIVDWYTGRDTELHVPPAEFLGRRQEDVVPSDVAGLFKAQFARVRELRAPETVQYSLHTPSGDDQFESCMVPLRETEAVAVIRNITGFRRAEAALRASEERLRASQKMEAIGRLAGGVAHDFNNLLTVVLGRIELLGRELPADCTWREYLDEIAEAARRATNLTRQLLTFGRRQRLDPRVLDVTAVVAEMRGILRRLIGEHIEITASRGETACNVKADRGQLEQVILNLALNARDAMPEGGTLSIHTHQTMLDEAEAQGLDGITAGMHVVLSVSDTGTGMSPDVMAHLFEPFFTTKPRGQGTGLGLATVYGIVKQSSGHVRASSHEGKGSTFEVLLPCASGPVCKTPVPQHEVPMERGTETLLVVEDEDALRRLIAEILGRCGYTVLAARDGDDALRILAEPRASAVSLLLTDVVMPGMSGHTLAGRARELYPGLKILMMTGYDETMTALRPGPAERPPSLIEKPFVAATLTRRVRELLDWNEEA